uniref:Sulfhydryl oxidase n=1 Tax=Lygus hesperus TaxID=30085 RepID=A0A0A9VZL1_LYGHE
MDPKTASKKPAAPCRACTDFKDWAKGKGVNIPEGMSSNKDEKPPHNDRECPLDKEELGKNTWSFLHTMAAYYPDEPSEKQKCHMKSFFKNFAMFYPCHICAEHFQEDIKLIPPEVSNADDLSKWLCFMHNRVNLRLGKEEFDCSRVRERWKDGWKDGSCD